MERNYNEEEKYQKAKKRVEEMKGFYGHLTSYIIVNLFLIFVNLKTSPEHLWFFWPTVGWGIGLIFHGLRVFNFLPFLGKDWEERKMKEYMEEEERRKNEWK